MKCLFLDRRPAKWAKAPPTKADIDSAVQKGRAALEDLREAERQRAPLAQDTPANRAQRAAATSPDVKPLADAAYAIEVATRVLANG